MTPNDFRRIALSLPDVVAASHVGHPDFRVGGMIFATLGYPDARWAMVKLKPEQQAKLVAAKPEVFAPVAGGWGRKGSTNVLLSAADRSAIKDALATAWENVASKPSAGRQKARRTTIARSAASKAERDLARAFARVRAAARAAKLPEVEEGVSYRTPAMKLRGKFLMRVKDPDTLVFRCTIEEKAMLMAAAPDIYFETDHYKGWPTILVRLSRASDAELRHCLERAWRLQAPAKLIAQREDPTGAGKPRRRRARISSHRQRYKRGTCARYIEHDRAAVGLRAFASGGRPAAIVVDCGAAEPHAGRGIECGRHEA